MAKISILAGSTSQTMNIFIRDSSSTTGAGLTGLAYNTASLTAYYALPKAASVAITLATLAAVTTAWSSGGFKEIDATNMPGWYRLDIPDAALASGRFVDLHLQGATNMAPCPVEIELTAWNNQDAVRGGLTSLPNAAAEAAGGLYTRGTGAGQINQAANGQIDANVKTWIGGTIPAVNVTGVPLVDAKYLLGTVFSTPATAGVLDVNLINIKGTASAGAAGYVGPDWSHVNAPMTALALTGTTISSAQKVDVDTIKTNPVVNAGTITFPNTATLASTTNITGGTITTTTNLTNAPTAGDFTAAMKTSLNAATPASVVGAVGSVTGLTASDVGAIKAKTDNLPLVPASSTNISAGVITTVTNLTNAPTAGDFTATMKSSIITAATAATPTAAAVTGDVGGNVIGGVGFVSGLNVSYIDAPISSRLASGSYIAPDNASITAIKAKTDNLPAAPASTTNITAGTITTVTNLTNSPTLGDLTATMKTSVTTAATAATPAAASVTGSVGSVVGLTPGNLDVAVSSRLAGGSYTPPDNTSITAIKAKTDLIPSAPASTTNITGGTITNLTNAPTVGDFTAAMKASITTAATAATPTIASVTGSVGAIVGINAPDIAAIKVKTDNLPAAPAAVSDIPTANANADALLDRSNALETGWTLRQALRIILSVLGGKASGLATTTAVFKNVTDTKTRVTATVDSDGNRSAVTLDGS